MFPQGGEQGFRVRGIHFDGDGARVVIDIKDLFPGLASVERPEDAALLVRSIRMTEAGNEHDVGIRRMNDETTHLLDVSESDMLPSVAAVGRFEDAVADAEVGPVQSFAGADVEDVRMRR